MSHEDKLRETAAALIAAIETVDFQIDELKNYRTPIQITIWRKQRKRLNKKLKETQKQISAYGTIEGIKEQGQSAHR